MHQLQGKTEGLTGPADGETYTRRTNCNSFLTDLTAERIALTERHEGGARVVGHYDFNNTYQ